jgi:hypothetical protein
VGGFNSHPVYFLPRGNHGIRSGSLSVVVGKIGGYKIQDPLYRAFQKTVLGTIGCSGIYYDLRTGKQYVEVYYLTCIKEIGEILNAV